MSSREVASREAASRPSARSSDGSSRCYICMEDKDDVATAPLTGVCACTSTCLHAKCLERLLNSKKSRSRPLRARLQCAVCTQPYNVPFSFYILDPYMPGPLGRFLATPIGMKLGPPLLILSFFSVIALVIWLVGRFNSLLAVAVLVALVVPILICQRVRIIRQRDLQQLDDNRFYSQAVVLRAYKEVAKGHEIPLHEALVVPEQNAVIVLVRPPGRSRSGSVRSAINFFTRSSLTLAGSGGEVGAALTSATDAAAPAPAAVGASAPPLPPAGTAAPSPPPSYEAATADQVGTVEARDSTEHV